MATKAKAVSSTKSRAGLNRETLLRFYRTMFAARRTDDQEILLKRQNKIFFQISGAGHEAVQVATAEHCRSGSDWFYFYYRDRAFSMALGVTPYEQLLQAVAAESDPASGGRQMPSHWGHRKYNIVSTSSPTGTQFLQSVGCAEVPYRASLVESLRKSIDKFEDDEIVICTTGEGQTSQGEFYEALMTATNLKLPVVFLVEDNGYAISGPVEVNTPGGSISKLLTGFPGLYIQDYDGTDVFDSYEAAGRAVEYCRKRKGPALLHAHVVRPYSHSMSDDERMYRPEAERADEVKRDPITVLRNYLIQENIASEADVKALEEEVVREVQESSDRALAQPQPAKDTAMLHLFSPDVDPTAKEFDTEDSPKFEGEETTMVDLINACLRDEMQRDPRIVVFGEDVADCSREDRLEEVKGKGGVFKVTWGLQRKFGGARVFNSPLAEANIVGRAVGMATRGLKP
ncbi:MAG TPA: thiamine pyrophosphate-dependent enzyme, partial [Longimicrobiales bacterium]